MAGKIISLETRIKVAKTYLDNRYTENPISQEDIALQFGVGIASVRKILKQYALGLLTEETFDPSLDKVSE
jgi:transposase